MYKTYFGMLIFYTKNTFVFYYLINNLFVQTKNAFVPNLMFFASHVNIGWQSNLLMIWCQYHSSLQQQLFHRQEKIDFCCVHTSLLIRQNEIIKKVNKRCLNYFLFKIPNSGKRETFPNKSDKKIVMHKMLWLKANSSI